MEEQLQEAYVDKELKNAYNKGHRELIQKVELQLREFIASDKYFNIDCAANSCSSRNWIASSERCCIDCANATSMARAQTGPARQWNSGNAARAARLE